MKNNEAWPPPNFSEALSDSDPRLALDITKAALNNEIQRNKSEGLIDEATGAYTPKAIDQIIKPALERPLQENEPVYLIFTDLDGFKQVNDSEGYQAGDTIISLFGEILSMNARHGVDFVIRIHPETGDEFAVVMQGNEEAVDAYVNRSRNSLESAAWGSGSQAGKNVGVSYSCGVERLTNLDDFNGTLERAAVNMKIDKEKRKKLTGTDR